MAGGKETPRQKMIGIMYLVLMTLLALNVSKEILNAFVTQDMQGLEQNDNLNESIAAIGTKLSLLKQDPQAKKSAEKVEPIFNDVKELSNTTDDFFVAELNKLFKEVEGVDNWFSKDENQKNVLSKDLGEMQKQDDYDTPTRLYAGEKGTESDKRGKAFREKLMEYRNQLLLKIASEVKTNKGTFYITEANLSSYDEFKTHLESTKHPEKDALLNIYKRVTKPEQLTVVKHGGEKETKDWNVITFDHQPAVAVVNVFTSLRNDLRFAEYDASKVLMQRVDVPMMNINKVEAQVLANTQYLNLGDELDVKIGIVAYDSTKTYAIKYRNDSTGEYATSDTSKLKIKAESPGPQYIEGKLLVEIAGELKERDWKFNYTVGKPSASIASPELNVMYMNYDNKIQAVASGYSEDQVKVSCSGCKSFSKSGQYYIAKVGGTKTASVTVTADGKKIGFQEFRVFPLPKPQAYFAGKTTGDNTIPSGLVKQGTKLTAKLADSPLNVPFEITSFDLEVVVKGKLIIEKGKGANLSGKMKNMLNNAGKGQKIYFTNVMAKGPSGGSKPIGDLSFKVL